MMCGASTVSSPPALSLTASLPLPASRASPSMTVTLFFFRRCPTPRESCCATCRERLTTAAGVEAQVVGLEAELLQVVHEVEDLGRAQQRLGRDAAPVEADAAQMLALDEAGLHPELGRTDGGDVAAGAPADDDEVELLGHGASPVRLARVRRQTVATSVPEVLALDSRGSPVSVQS